MRIVSSLGPIVEPVTVEQAKLYCRIDLDADDDIVEMLIFSSRQFIEDYCQISLIAQTKTIYYDLYDVSLGRAVDLPVSPVLSIESLNSYDTGGTGAIYPSDDYFISGDRLVLADSASWPRGLRTFDSFAVEVKVGYGETSDSIPGPIINALYKLIAHGYQNREACFDSVNGTFNYQNVPWSVTALLQRYRSFIGYL